MTPPAPPSGGLPDGGAEPGVPDAAMDGAAYGIADGFVHRPCLAERTAQLPRISLGVAFKYERTFPRSDEDEHFLRHFEPPKLASCREHNPRCAIRLNNLSVKYHSRRTMSSASRHALPHAA